MSQWISRVLGLAGRSPTRIARVLLGSATLLVLLALATIGVHALSGAATSTVVAQIAAGWDDVGEIDGVLSASSPTIWLGNASAGSSSYVGLRFTGVLLPAGATIRSANLEVHSSSDQWIATRYDIRAEAVGQSAPFGTGSLPSQRALTAQLVRHASDTPWRANTWYPVADLAPLVQEVVSRTDWTPGNSLSIVVSGSGSAWGRKSVNSFDGSPTTSPRLVIQYDASTSPPSATPTSTSTPTPALTARPSPTAPPPPTAATLTSTPTPSPTPLPAELAVDSTFFPIGPGYVDVIPHQVVRADNGRLYVFANQSNVRRTILAYRTRGVTPPTSAADFVQTSIDVGSDVVSLEAAYGGGSIVHVLVNTMSGTVWDYPYDVTADTFRPRLALATDAGANSGIGTSGLSAMVDKTGLLHIVYWSSAQRIVYQSYRYQPGVDSIQRVRGPELVDPGGRIARHPVLAVSPLDGSVLVAWISPRVSSNLASGDVFARTLASNGVWGSVIQVSRAAAWTSTIEGIDIDQGPSVVVGSDGVVHLAYIENYDSSGDYGRVRYVRGAQASWTEIALPVYTHDPALAIDGAGALYLIGHGHPFVSTCPSMRDLCWAPLGSQGLVGPFQLFARAPASASFDASPSTKWSVAGWNQPGAVEFAFFSANGGSYAETTLYYGRLAGVFTYQAQPSATPAAPASPLPTATPASTSVIPRFVQSAIANSVGEVASQTVSTSAPIGAGSLLVVAVSAFSHGVADVTSVSDSLGNRYSRAVANPSAPEGNHHLSLWYATSARGGTAVTVTASAPAGDAEYLTVAVHEYSPDGAQLVLDQAQGMAGSGSIATSGRTGVTAADRELVVGAHLHKLAGVVGVSVSVEESLREKVTDGRFEPLVTADRLTTTRGQQESRVVWSSPVEWQSVVATFR